jgi:hypothetical protein
MLYRPSPLRKSAIALTTVAAMFAGAAAHAGDFTPEQCRSISAVGISVAKAVGPSTLSTEFKQSFRNFLGPDLTCDGPKDILTATPDDVAAFNTIKQVLFAPPAKISLTSAGLRSVDPGSVATVRPTSDKRTDADAKPAPKIN